MQEDREVQKAISNIGIGTPAIRASIIETLLSTNYIIRKMTESLQVRQRQKDNHCRMTAELEIAEVSLCEWIVRSVPTL
jgi:DNA topoisomerase-3